MTKTVKIDMKTVEFMDKLQVELDKLKYSVLKEDFEDQLYISGEIERVAIGFRKYQVRISDSERIRGCTGHSAYVC